MHIPRIRLCFGVLTLVGALVFSCWLLRPAHAEQAGTRKSGKVRELQQERLAALRKLVAITTEHYRKGEATSEDLRSATRARDEAELELSTSNTEKLAILERIVQEAKQVEEQNEKLVANKLAPESSLLTAKADRLQQEIILEQAKSN